MGKIYVGIGPARLLGDLLGGSGKQVMEVYRGSTKIWPDSIYWNYTIGPSSPGVRIDLLWYINGLSGDIIYSDYGIGEEIVTGSLPLSILQTFLANSNPYFGRKNGPVSNGTIYYNDTIGTINTPAGSSVYTPWANKPNTQENTTIRIIES